MQHIDIPIPRTGEFHAMLELNGNPHPPNKIIGLFFRLFVVKDTHYTFAGEALEDILECDFESTDLVPAWVQSIRLDLGSD